MSSILLIQANEASSRRWESTLAGDARYTISSSVNSLADARRALAQRRPDLVIADLRLPDGPIAGLLRGQRPATSHTLVTTASLHDPHLMHALRSGADGFLLAGQSSEALLNVIRLTLAGGSPIAPEIARQVLALFDALNARPVPVGGAPITLPEAMDRELLAWTSAGYWPQEIARRMNVSQAEIGRRVRALYRNLRFERSASAGTWPHAA